MSRGDILEQALASVSASQVDHVVVPEDVLMLNNAVTTTSQSVAFVLHSVSNLGPPYSIQPVSQSSLSSNSQLSSSSSSRPLMSTAVSNTKHRTQRPLLPKQVAMVGPVNGAKVIAYNLADVKALVHSNSVAQSKSGEQSVKTSDKKVVKTYFPEDLFPTKMSLIKFLESDRKRAAPKPLSAQSAQSKLRKQFGLTIDQARMAQHGIVDSNESNDKNMENKAKEDEETITTTSAPKPSIVTRSGREVRPVNLEAESESSKVAKPKSFLPGEPKPKRKLSVPPQYRCRVCNKIYLGDRKMRRHMKLYPDHGPPTATLPTATSTTMAAPTPTSSTLVSSLNIPIIPLARTQLEELVKNLDAELVLDVVAKKMFDNFSMWQLTTKKMSLAKKTNEKGSSSRLARVQQTLAELDVLLSEVKGMVDNCLTDTKLCDATAESCTMGENVQAALNVHEGPWYLEHPKHIPEEFQRLLDLHVDVPESSVHPLTSTLLTSSCDENSNSLLSNSSDTGLASKVVLERNLGATDSMDGDDNDDEEEHDEQDHISKKNESKDDEDDVTGEDTSSKLEETSDASNQDEAKSKSIQQLERQEASSNVEMSLMESTNARLNRSARELAIEIDSLGPFPPEDEASGDKGKPLPSFSSIINKADEIVNKGSGAMVSQDSRAKDDSLVTQSNFKLLHVALEQHPHPKVLTNNGHVPSTSSRSCNLPMSGPPSVVPISEVAQPTHLDVTDLANHYVSGPPSVDVGHNGGYVSMSGPPSVQHNGRTVEINSIGSPVVSMTLSNAVSSSIISHTTTSSLSLSGSPGAMPVDMDRALHGDGFASFAKASTSQQNARQSDTSSMSPIVSLALSQPGSGSMVLQNTSTSSMALTASSSIVSSSNAHLPSNHAMSTLTPHYVSATCSVERAPPHGPNFVSMPGPSNVAHDVRSEDCAHVQSSKVVSMPMTESTTLMKPTTSLISQQSSQQTFSSASSVHLVEDVPLSPRVEMPLPCLTQAVNNHSSMNQLSAPSSVVSNENHYEDQVNVVVGDLFENNNDFCEASNNLVNNDMEGEEESHLKPNQLHTENLNALLNDLDSVLSEAGDFDQLDLKDDGDKDVNASDRGDNNDNQNNH